MSNTNSGVLYWELSEEEYQTICGLLEGTGFDLNLDFSLVSPLRPGYVYAALDSVSEAERNWLLFGDDDFDGGIELGTYTFTLSNQPSHRM